MRQKLVMAAKGIVLCFAWSIALFVTVSSGYCWRFSVYDDLGGWFQIYHALYGYDDALCSYGIFPLLGGLYICHTKVKAAILA